MTVHFGDCRNVMRTLIAKGEKAQMCVTSPPYYGLRDYGVDGQMGLEPTLQEYIDTMVEVFSLVWELLEDDGTCWINIGDSYAGSWGAQDGQGKNGELTGRSAIAERQRAAAVRKKSGTGSLDREPVLKPKDLCLVPARLAIALQEWGWYVRQDVIWEKRNPMPESVRDRFTKAHEYVFLLAKSERYYFDQDAVREPRSHAYDKPVGTWSNGQGSHSPIDHARPNNQIAGKYDYGTAKSNDRLAPKSDRRNKRTVWSIATEAYAGAHFATFPTALIEPCILAGSRPGDVVLDPFFGSGTTGQVCNQLGRQHIGIELNREYESMQRERCSQQALEL